MPMNFFGTSISFGSENLGICLDTGHLNISQFGDQEDVYKKSGKTFKKLCTLPTTRANVTST